MSELSETKIIQLALPNQPIIRKVDTTQKVDIESKLVTQTKKVDKLSPEQMIAFDKFTEGHNLFISGPGGVGKSYLINTMVKHVEASGKKIAVTALTGCAAILLGVKARTIHSWSGIKFMNTSVSDEDIIKRISKNRIACAAWRSTNVLVVDEVSMMPIRMFELLNNLGQIIRRSMKPFGGLQVVFTGDFYQLPPVCPNEEVRFAFESSKWIETFRKENHIELTTFFRQRDPEFIKILMEVRKGELTQESIDRLIELVGKEKLVDDIITKIYPTRSKVESINKLMFDKLPDTTHVFNAVRKTNERYYYVMSGREDLVEIEYEYLIKCDDLTPDFSRRELDSMVTNFNIIERLELKKGALVMLTVNISIETGLCNGTQGIVIGFDDTDGYPIVKFTNRKVATIRPNPYQNHEYPTHVIHQVPLCLAWALTIHKTQGATLEQIEVDIGSSVFEFGQTYVALSRVKTLEGLYLTNFDPLKIRANPKVKRFYNKEN
jgi:ATP-dependent DNA helicase PIF1